MSKLSQRLPTSIRKRYIKLFPPTALKPLEYDKDPNHVSDVIYKMLQSGVPCMIARFGSVELGCVVNYLGVKNKSDIKLYSWERRAMVVDKPNTTSYV